MNILWLAAAPHPAKVGHPTPWMTALANSIVAGGDVRITIVSYNSAIEKDEEVIRNGVRYLYLKVPDDKWDLLSGYTRRIKTVRNFVNNIAGEFDLMHIHGIEQQYHVMASGVRIPKVLSAQGFVTEYYKYLDKRPSYRHVSWAVAGYYEKRYTSTVKHFICRTHWDKSVIRKLQPGAVIHHNWEMMRPEFYHAIRTPVDEKANAMLFVGGLNEIKGIREALQTLNQLRLRIPVRLIVTGYGSKEELLQMVKAMNLTNIRDEDVEHRGMLSAAQLWDAYSEAFCLLHPSYIDNSPNSVCEAQLAGLPVVASDVGGVASLVESNRTGLLTSLDPNDIARSVQQLWEDPSLRQQLAAQARTVSLERYDAQHITNETKSIYQKVLANP